MAATRHPLIDLVYNDETGRYIGMLERKILKLTIDDIKFRSLLELLTGDDWDDYHFDAEDEEIQKLAIDTLKRRLGLSEEDAQRLVTDRWNQHNPAPPDPSARTYLIGPDPNSPAPTPHNVTVSRPVDHPTTQATYDVQRHLAGLQTAHEHRENYRNQV